MPCKHRLAAAAAVALAVSSPTLRAADDAAERQSLDEVRNTVINMLQALVDKGLLTREQAQALVKQAQDKAAADAAAAAAKNAAQAKEEQNAVRVPYVPQIVKDEISKEVAQQVEPSVTQDVVQQAKTEGWGVPGALPEWLSRVRVFGDVTVREQADLFPNNNSDQLIDVNAVNAAGGFLNTAQPYLDSTHDRYRVRLRARLGAEGDVSDNVRAVIRLASGSLTQIASSESQTLGSYGNRYSVGIDQAFIEWDSNARSKFSINTLEGGRLPNPWFSPTEAVYGRDLTFEGIADTVRVGWGNGDADRSHVYLTMGAFPMLEVPLESQADKWMLGAQLGTNLRFNDGADHLRLAIAYYDFLRVTGVLNPLDSTVNNFTAPPFVQWGNTVWNIANNPTNPAVGLLALAAHFRIADVAGTFEHNFGRYSLAFNGEAVRNLGYNLTDIEALSGQTFPSSQNKGYVGELSFGDPIVESAGRWRLAAGYRYMQADAVLDAWTDADFHDGGTNDEGYYFWASVGVAPHTWLRLRYFSANTVYSLQKYSIDTLQLDANVRF
jgi:hypothetical protein